jgi:molecular chaperone GrpE
MQDSEQELNQTPQEEAPETEQANSLEVALDEEKKKAEEYLANWQRAQADFINYKRRTDQEKQDFSTYANASLLLKLLPLADDLDRAFESIPEELADVNWVEGIKLIDRKFRSVLEAQGVKPIKSVGEPFDPNFHEAIRQDSGKEGLILAEVEKGYMMHDKLLRAAKVIVGNGEEDRKEK